MGSSIPYRTLVSYKETLENDTTDPADPPTWTGTWRDPRFSPPADGGRPENALTGTIFMVNGPQTDSIDVPANDGKMRFWRNTSIANLAPGQTATLPNGTLGYEWDWDLDNGSRPTGLFHLSTTSRQISNKILTNWGGNYGGSGTAVHNLTLYRAPSGALVFGAGTVQWAWGLDGNHDRGSLPPDVRMQQATLNLFADMGIQPATMQSGLVPATASTDLQAPTSSVQSPLAGSTVQGGVPVTITGIASDAGSGVVGGVEVSTDGGQTWHPAAGRGSWTYTWTPQEPGVTTILSRAVDDSANLGSPSGIQVAVEPRPCPCSIWDDSTTPTVPSVADTRAVSLGVRFRPLVDGYITGVRFYKGEANNGTHVGHLWTDAGSPLASVTFSGETSSGWQQAMFGTPVPVSAGTVYVASYFAPSGRYAEDQNYFVTSPHTNWPLEAPMDWISGRNGVYRYGPDQFPTKGSGSSNNFWVDVAFQEAAEDTQPPTVTGRTPAPGATNVATTTTATATFNESVQAGSITFELRNPQNALVPATVTYDNPSRTASLTPSSPLAASTTYSASVRATDLAGNQMPNPVTWSFTTAAAPPPDGCPCSIWSASAVPVVASSTDIQPVEVGVKFRSSQNGFITGIRFYKGPNNSGSHIGNLWTTSGTLLSSVTFTSETSSGWQQAIFSSPVPVTAGTVYVASYHTDVGRYAEDKDFFTTTGVVNGPLEAPAASAVGGNGVFVYGASAFPSRTPRRDTNYWVDVVFTTTP